MNEFFRLIGEIVRDFSWRRISSLFLLLLFILAGLAIFESYTDSFRLGRIERAVGILERIEALEGSESLRLNDELADSYDSLVSSLTEVVLQTGDSRAWSPTILKILFAATPWGLLMIPFLVQWRRKGDASARSAFLGTLVVSVPFIVAGALIPLSTHRWINYGVYPWGAWLLIMAILLVFSKARGK